MRYLQIVNVAVVVVGSVMAINLAVVCVLYLTHAGSAPRISSDLPGLYTLTALFTGLGMAGAVAFLAHRRHWPSRWLVQALPIVPVLGVSLFLTALGN